MPDETGEISEEEQSLQALEHIEDAIDGINQEKQEYFVNLDKFNSALIALSNLQLGKKTLIEQYKELTGRKYERPTREQSGISTAGSSSVAQSASTEGTGGTAGTL
ncbi:hypothetical protein NCC49_005353 [Naganishia albida]|nr:hypothetical protein NCC49_005353 [Naganishia albida]